MSQLYYLHDNSKNTAAISFEIFVGTLGTSAFRTGLYVLTSVCFLNNFVSNHFLRGYIFLFCIIVYTVY